MDMKQSKRKNIRQERKKVSISNYYSIVWDTKISGLLIHQKLMDLEILW